MERTGNINRRKFLAYVGATATSALLSSACAPVNDFDCFQFSPADGTQVPRNQEFCERRTELELNGRSYAFSPLFFPDLEPYLNKHGEVFDLTTKSFTSQPERNDLLLANLPTPSSWEDKNGEYPLQIHPGFILNSPAIKGIEDRMHFQRRMTLLHGEPLVEDTQLAQIIQSELGYYSKPRPVGIVAPLRINSKKVKCFELATMMSLCSAVLLQKRVDILYYNYYDRDKNTVDAHALNIIDRDGLALIDVNDSRFHEPIDMQSYLTIQNKSRELSQVVYHLSLYAGASPYPWDYEWITAKERKSMTHVS